MDNAKKMSYGMKALIVAALAMVYSAFIGSIAHTVSFGFIATLIALYIHDYREIETIKGKFDKHELK